MRHIFFVIFPVLLNAAVIYYSDHRSFQGGSSILVDLNKDGTNDVRLSTGAIHDNVTATITLTGYAQSLDSNSFCGLNLGDNVDENCDWQTGNQALGPIKVGPYCMGIYPPSSSCIQPGYPCSSFQYLGVKFYSAGKVHFGWIELDVTGTTNSTVHSIGPDFYGIRGYGYDDIENKPLSVGSLTSTNLHQSETTFRLYPNPASDVIYINGPQEFDKEITIINSLGEIVKSILTADNRLDISTIQNGQYILVVIVGENRKSHVFSKHD